MKALYCVVMLAACAVDETAVEEDVGAATCGKHVHVWFEPTSGMEAIDNSNGCWTYENMVAASDGWGWCNEINGTMNVVHAPADTYRWFFDDTSPVRTAALDEAQIKACYHAMPKHVAGIEVMSRRRDVATGELHWQKLVVSGASGWIVNHWIAELHASGDDVASYFDAWRADPGIGVPQVNARNSGAGCDSRVYSAVLEACRAVPPGGKLSIVKNDGRLAFDGGCLTHVVRALDACTAP